MPQGKANNAPERDDRPDAEEQGEQESQARRERGARKKSSRKAKLGPTPTPRVPPRHPTVRQMARAALLERMRIEQQLIRSAKEQIPLPLEFVEDPKVGRRRRSSELTREELLQRLLEPLLTLGETAKILDVHPATVRRYANKGILPHIRTPGNQRRFKLSDVLRFLQDREERLALYRLSREPRSEEPGELLDEEQ